MTTPPTPTAPITPADDHSGCRTVPVQHHASWAARPAEPQAWSLDTVLAHAGTASPTRDVLQDALARLDGGTAGFALSSGMAAIQLAVETLAPYGSRVVALEDLYGGTYRYLQVLAEDGAYEVDFVIGEEGLR